MMLAGLEISTDKARLDMGLIVNYLQNSYWAANIPETIVRTSIENSIAFGAYLPGQQIGFARVVTDCATFAYLADVFVLPEFSGQGVAQAMLNAVFTDARLQGLRRFVLATRDAHSLYEKFGFERLSEAENQNVMQIRPVVGY